MQANGYLPKSQENGFTLLEMLVSLLIFSILMGSAASTMFSSFSYSLDAEIIARTEERARSTLDLLLFDLRMMGCGVAIGQEDFSITDGSLGDAPFPVFTDSTASYIHFRMNETGKDALLTADYTPSSSSLTFSVSSTEDYFEGDVIYLSDKIAGGNDALEGEVSAVSAATITIENDYIASTSASFPAGSTVNRVSEVEYTAVSNWGGITRNNGLGSVTIVPEATFSIDYLDGDGNSMSLPLDADDIGSSLSSLEVQVQVRSDRPLKDGSTYTALAETTVTARALYFY